MRSLDDRPAHIPYGYCWCGCGERTTISRCNCNTRGHRKGEPKPFIKGHSKRKYRGEGANPSGLCWCGCGQTTGLAAQSNPERGDIQGTHVRFVVGHGTRGKKLRLVGPEYDVDPETGCWNWLRAQYNGRGYTMARLAARVFYEREHGPIPDRRHLHHLCRNKLCVNPAHLEPMTPEDHGRLHALEQAA